MPNLNPIILFACLVALSGCFHPSSEPPTQLSYSHGKCFFWESIEKDSYKAKSFCLTAPKTGKSAFCTRAYGHRGKHHFHTFSECARVWGQGE